MATKSLQKSVWFHIRWLELVVLWNLLASIVFSNGKYIYLSTYLLLKNIFFNSSTCYFVFTPLWYLQSVLYNHLADYKTSIAFIEHDVLFNLPNST